MVVSRSAIRIKLRTLPFLRFEGFKKLLRDVRVVCFYSGFILSCPWAQHIDSYGERGNGWEEAECVCERRRSVNAESQRKVFDSGEEGLGEDIYALLEGKKRGLITKVSVERVASLLIRRHVCRMESGWACSSSSCTLKVHLHPPASPVQRPDTTNP
jgi:hypothetical protein